MSFQPKRNNGSGDGSGKNDFLYPGPNSTDAGGANHVCRVSLIVDMGIQERENYVEAYNSAKKEHVEALATRGAHLTTPEYGDDAGVECISIPQKPKQAVAVFVDLVDDGVVNYGGNIGEAQYRYMLNREFKNVVSPITFDAVPPKGKSKLWTFHGGSVLTKLAKATKNTQIISDGKDNMDISQLLNQSCLIDLEVSKTPKTDGGHFTNVKHAALSKLRDGEEIAELGEPALLVSFAAATKDEVKFIRKCVRDKIVLAKDFVGSQMEAAFVEAGYCEAGEKPESNSAPAPEPEPQEAPQEPTGDDDFDSDVPF